MLSAPTVQSHPPATIKFLRLLPSWLVYFVTGRRFEEPSRLAKSSKTADEKTRALFTLLIQLKRQADQIAALKRSLEETKTQNIVVVKTLRDIHLVLTTLTTQGAEHKSELFELRKRLTDFHEDTVGKFLYSNSNDLQGGISSSSLYDADEYGGLDSETSSISEQMISSRRASDHHKAKDI